MYLSDHSIHHLQLSGYNELYYIEIGSSLFLQLAHAGVVHEKSIVLSMISKIVSIELIAYLQHDRIDLAMKRRLDRIE